ncbi:MAG: hypothetical protein KIT84_16050 [Labilithrix sp.]|nr:hypothetical protein [Labilithrix sp.]MCW5812541.1 hypothetical protein [Labilithrix sp.]
METEFRKEVDKALDDLEQLADEVRVKLHLAELDARDAWSLKLEPRLFEARMHAREATAASKAAIEATAKAFRDFVDTI